MKKINFKIKSKTYLFLIKILLRIHNFSYTRASVIAVKLENGLHPKHRITKYHNYFIQHVKKTDIVLDVGCGNGFNTLKISEAVKEITGIDNNKKNINLANKNYKMENIKYIFADVMDFLPERKFDVVILSNVLEHIEDRVNILKKLKKIGKKILIRVPLIDRNWITIYKKELNIEYRLDKTHLIEYTLNDFKEEIEQAGCKINSFEIRFGELFAEVE